MGELDVLSVGKGHLKITIGENNPIEVERARRVIEDMMRRGYALFVEDKGELKRVRKFDPKRMEYIVDATLASPAGNDSAWTVETTTTTQEPPRKRGRPTKAVPVAGSKATAVGRMAGG